MSHAETSASTDLVDSLAQLMGGDPEGAFNAAVDSDSMSSLQIRIVLLRFAAQNGVADSWLNLGLLLSDSGDEPGAEEAWRRSVALGDRGGAFMLAQLLEGRGEHDEALSMFLSARPLDGSSLRAARIHEARGEVDTALRLLAESRWTEAESAVECVLRAEEGHEGEYIELLEHHLDRGAEAVLIPLAGLYEAVGRTTDAEGALRRSLAEGEPNARLNLGMLLYEQGEVAEGLRLAEEAFADGDVKAGRWLERVARAAGAVRFRPLNSS
ncbi:MAG: tetratricopeptide repeat protein [Cellulomonadaceae bacterium]|nr:tetratricopeptide repeat protein [Cellulomonadaceae bacterium]